MSQYLIITVMSYNPSIGVRSCLASEAVLLAAELALVDVVVLVDEAPSLAAGRAAVERVLGRSPRLLQRLLLVDLVLRLGEDLRKRVHFAKQNSHSRNLSQNLLSVERR